MATSDGELNHKTQGSSHPSDWVGLDSIDGPGSRADTTNIVLTGDWLFGDSTLTAVYGFSKFEWQPVVVPRGVACTIFVISGGCDLNLRVLCSVRTWAIVCSSVFAWRRRSS